LLCPDCRLVLAPEVWPCCPRCAAVGSSEEGSPQGCCRETPLHFDAAIALGGYHSELRKVVLRMKHPPGEPLSGAVGRLLALRRGELLARLATDLIVPIPMHWSRRLGRGANSPEILADCLGRFLGVAVGLRVLSRERNTLPQADLSARERFHNVRGAFRVRRGRPLGGLRILLVDDILTTGATCSEAAKTLKQAGAAMVAAAVIARAQPSDPTYK
jgi:ComF family protein